MHNIILITDRVKKLLDDSNIYKVNGSDEISARILKETSKEITEVMTLLFQASLTQSDIPNPWRETLISLLLKVEKKDHKEAENYRPIRLTSISCKVLKHILHINTMKHLEKKTTF